MSCLALCNPMDCSAPGSSVHGILQARILEWVAIPSLGHLPEPKPLKKRSRWFSWVPLWFLAFRAGVVVDRRASVCAVYVCFHTCGVFAGRAEADAVQAGGPWAGSWTLGCWCTLAGWFAFQAVLNTWGCFVVLAVVLKYFFYLVFFPWPAFIW